ncbi:hypothetical protein N7474_000883 [Penicillium riverlandense]|uniref:uncharacterized protein n=1 Tax=Penicillium riverlandense TaxID=1903569 RepID=UPI002546CA33|nr:uncharacterized protein N7474_000883 [Penicillium riverlandense]KAJ5832572.1 hypothetical protein N7474_000883 [Penicillium riverlandense]
MSKLMSNLESREKITMEHVEAADELHHEPTEDDLLPSERKKILHKIDRRLITALGLMFAVSLIDRANLGSANIAGMAKELELEKGSRFSLSILMFFVPYVLCQWPSAILVRKMGPRIFLPVTAVAWGIVMLCFGFVKSWVQLVGLRVIVGVFEAGLLPGTLFLLQVWYCRYDVHKRYAAFYSISITCSSLSGVLAYGFMQMSGVGGLLGWRYIFIWEGVLTCMVAFVAAFLIVDFPHNAHKRRGFLTAQEIAYVMSMLEKDRKDIEDEPFTWRAFLTSALDLKIWGFGLIFAANTVISYSITFFLPIILNSRMGFNVGLSQVLSTPPFFFAAVQYFGVFLVTAAAQSTIPCVMAYQANNVCGQWKRAFASATLVTSGGTGGIIGALVFRSQDAPEYLPDAVAFLSF